MNSAVTTPWRKKRSPRAQLSLGSKIKDTNPVCKIENLNNQVMEVFKNLGDIDAVQIVQIKL